MDLKTLASIITMLQGASGFVYFIIVFILVVLLLAILAKTGLIKFILGKFKKPEEDALSTKLDSLIESTKNIETGVRDVVKEANHGLDKEIYKLTLSVNNVVESVNDLKYKIDDRDEIKNISHKIDIINDSTGRGY